MSKQQTRYVSDMDTFLNDFDRSHAATDSQQAEIAKYQQIAKQRDNIVQQASENTTEETLWKDF